MISWESPVLYRTLNPFPRPPGPPCRRRIGEIWGQQPRGRAGEAVARARGAPELVRSHAGAAGLGLRVGSAVRAGECFHEWQADPGFYAWLLSERGFPGRGVKFIAR